MGKSRSVTLVIAYIMKKYKMGFKEAFHFVKRKRREASPNEGFVFQLGKYEETLKEEQK